MNTGQHIATQQQPRRGTIYEIYSNNSALIYIGSTTKSLSSRLSIHRCQFKRYLAGKEKKYYSSFEVLKCGDCGIRVLEEIQFHDKKTLLAREGHWQKTKECVNIRRANRTLEQMAQEDPELYDAFIKRKNQASLRWSKCRINCFHCGKELNRGSLNGHKKSQHKNIPIAPALVL